MLLTHIEAFFSQKYALFSNHCPLLPNCFLRLKEDNNRSVAAFTLVSRAAGKLDVRAGCVCGERCAGSSPQPPPRVRRDHVGARGHSRDCRDFSSTQVTLWKYSTLFYTIPDVWHSYIDICIVLFLRLDTCAISSHAGRISPGSGA